MLNIPVETIKADEPSEDLEVMGDAEDEGHTI